MLLNIKMHGQNNVFFKRLIPDKFIVPVHEEDNYRIVALLSLKVGIGDQRTILQLMRRGYNLVIGVNY